MCAPYADLDTCWKKQRMSRTHRKTACACQDCVAHYDYARLIFQLTIQLITQISTQISTQVRSHRSLAGAFPACARQVFEMGSSKTRTLRSRLLFWISGPLIALWMISTLIDHDVATGFVNLNFDRALLDTALDLGRNVRESGNQLYLDLPQPVIEMLISGEQGRFYYRANGPGGEYITGDPDLPDSPPEAQEDRVTYYDALFRNEPIRAVALRVPVRPGSGKGAILIQVAERSSLRADFARQIMLRMMLPQAILVLLSALAVWFGVGIGLRALTSMRREIENRSHVDLSPINETGAPAEVVSSIKLPNRSQ